MVAIRVESVAWDASFAMSNIGTSLAAGVAQTALNAQQAGRARDKRTGDRWERANTTAALLDQRVREAEDPDAADQELPDRAPPGYERLYRRRPAAESVAETVAIPAGDSGEYHLDVTA